MNRLYIVEQPHAISGKRVQLLLDAERLSSYPPDNYTQIIGNWVRAFFEHPERIEIQQLRIEK